MTAVARVPHEETELDPLRWWALLVLSLALLVVTMGNAAVNIALPVLSHELDATTQDLQWVVAAYGLSLAALLFTGGALGDRFGRRGALLLGLLLFLGASVLAASIPSLSALIASRALMGAAAALLLPASLAILVETFAAAERNTAISVWTSALGVGGAFAPFATGWVLAEFAHGFIFLISTPLILVALVGGVLWVRPSSDPSGARLDIVGCLLSMLGFVLLVFAIIEAPRIGWLSLSTLGTLLVGLSLLSAFVRWELRCDQPMIEVRLFKDPVARLGVLGTAFYFLAVQGIMFLTTQHLQAVAGHSPLVAGAANIPWGFAVIAASLGSVPAVRSFGSNRVVAASALLVASSSVALGALLKADQPLWIFVGLLTGFHIGIGLGVAPLTAAIMSGVSPRRAGAGAALNSTARELGGALGVAIMGTVAATVYVHQLQGPAEALPAGSRDGVLSSIGGAKETLAGLQANATTERVLAASRSAFDQGFTAVLLLVGAAALLLAVVAGLVLPGGAPKRRRPSYRRLRRRLPALSSDGGR